MTCTQVFASYGAKPSHELLLSYGFVPLRGRNAHEAISVAPPVCACATQAHVPLPLATLPYCAFAMFMLAAMPWRCSHLPTGHVSADAPYRREPCLQSHRAAAERQAPSSGL